MSGCVLSSSLPALMNPVWRLSIGVNAGFAFMTVHVRISRSSFGHIKCAMLRSFCVSQCLSRCVISSKLGMHCKFKNVCRARKSGISTCLQQRKLCATKDQHRPGWQEQLTSYPICIVIEDRGLLLVTYASIGPSCALARLQSWHGITRHLTKPGEAQHEIGSRAKSLHRRYIGRSSTITREYRRDQRY